MIGSDYAIPWVGLFIVLIGIGCGLGLLLARIGPALWQGVMAFWRALRGGV